MDGKLYDVLGRPTLELAHNDDDFLMLLGLVSLAGADESVEMLPNRALLAMLGHLAARVLYCEKEIDGLRNQMVKLRVDFIAKEEKADGNGTNAEDN